jgi:hypothetical protein
MVRRLSWVASPLSSSVNKCGPPRGAPAALSQCLLEPVLGSNIDTEQTRQRCFNVAQQDASATSYSARADGPPACKCSGMRVQRDWHTLFFLVQHCPLSLLCCRHLIVFVVYLRGSSAASRVCAVSRWGCPARSLGKTRAIGTCSTRKTSVPIK